MYGNENNNIEAIKKTKTITISKNLSPTILISKKDRLKISKSVTTNNSYILHKNKAEDFLRTANPIYASAVLSAGFIYAYFCAFYKLCLVKKLNYLYTLILVFFSVILFSRKILSSNNFRRPPPILINMINT